MSDYEFDLNGGTMLDKDFKQPEEHSENDESVVTLLDSIYSNDVIYSNTGTESNTLCHDGPVFSTQYGGGLNNTKSEVDHPKHYGGKDNPYEAIKVIENWDLGFNLGNTLKYISRAGKKDSTKTIQDLEKAKFYLDREIEKLKNGQK